jgi:hypothetical protein
MTYKKISSNSKQITDTDELTIDQFIEIDNRDIDELTTYQFVETYNRDINELITDQFMNAGKKRYR